jgi:signal transduction histidine kinase
MQSKGIEPDPYTLRELNQYSRNTPSQVGRRLDAGQSFQFGALTTILDDLRHELSHFVGKISLRLQTIGDLADEMNLQAIQEQSGAALHLAQEFSQRISEYSEVADPSSSGASSLKSGLDGLQKRFATDLKQLGIDFRVNGFEGYHNVFVNLSQWQLSAVLDGLVSNSVNALREWDGPRNIRVLVVIPKDPQPGEIVAITISDSGPGISPEIEEQIFDKGFTSRRSRGFGLGLAVVRGIVHGSGGYIQYNPNRNLNQTGAEFLVQLLIGESE